MNDILLFILLSVPVILMLKDPPSKEWLEQQERDINKIKRFFKNKNTKDS